MGVAGLMSAATLSLRNQQRGEHRAAALYLAQEKLAEVDLIGAHVWMLARPTQGVEARAGVAYEWSLQILQQQMGKLFVVRVQVTWAGPSAGSIELETWLNDYEARAATPGSER